MNYSSHFLSITPCGQRNLIVFNSLFAMVWGLFPVDPLPGENGHYIFREGTYQVGRKGCDIIVNKDKGVSRVHAEIIVDEMICVEQSPKRQSSNSSKVRLRDCSKYGTFITKNTSFKEKVHESMDKELVLKDGDIVTFGTGNASYRFSFVPLVLFASSSKHLDVNQLQDKMSLIGASVIQFWNSKCTHVICDDVITISDDIINIMLAGKPLVKCSWIESIAGKTICTEIPSSLSHAPNLNAKGVTRKCTDPQSREKCLEGYTFILESAKKYKFKEKLPLLLELASAKVVCVETYDDSSHSSHRSGRNLIYVIPVGYNGRLEGHSKFTSLPKVIETELFLAVVSGHLDQSVITTAPELVVTSSCSTDETIVAESDVEMETATSIHTSVALNSSGSPEAECKRMVEINKAGSSEYDHSVKNVVIVESADHDSGENRAVLETNENEILGTLCPIKAASKPNSYYPATMKSDSLSSHRDKYSIVEKDNGLASDSPMIDVIFCQDLIVRDSNLPQPGHSATGGANINFKLFKKTSTPSGNSFSDLIPFSKYPFAETDYGGRDLPKSGKEDKKRKEMEAVAEDLFNNVKVKKRGASGSLSRFLARG